MRTERNNLRMYKTEIQVRIVLKMNRKYIEHEIKEKIIK